MTALQTAKPPTSNLLPNVEKQELLAVLSKLKDFQYVHWFGGTPSVGVDETSLFLAFGKLEKLDVAI